jgi:Flp pilus assembly pilin Flp
MQAWIHGMPLAMLSDMKFIQRQGPEEGQGLVEYLVLTCLVAVAAISVVSVVGKNIREQYSNVSRAITRGDGQSQKFSEVNERHLEARGFQNYMENTDAAKGSK